MFLTLFAFMALSLAATPSDVQEVSLYATGKKPCRSVPVISPSSPFAASDPLYLYLINVTVMHVEGVNEMSVWISHGGFSGGKETLAIGEPISGHIIDRGQDGVIDEGVGNFLVANTGDRRDGNFYSGGGRMIGEVNRPMWQRIYDRAISATLVGCRPLS
jgi:hypothetical protein